MLSTHLQEWWGRSEDELRVAAAAGSTPAAYRLGLVHLERGEPEEARRLWVEVVQSNAADDLVVAAAAGQLARLAEGDDAKKWWRVAADRTDAFAALMGLPPPPPGEGTSREQRSGREQVENWRRYGGLLLVDGNKVGFEWLAQAAEANDVPAMGMLAAACAGYAWTVRDDERVWAIETADTWAARAAAAGDGAPLEHVTRVLAPLRDLASGDPPPSPPQWIEAAATPADVSEFFASLGDPIVIRRAAYFSDLRRRLASLPWNPFEPMALGLEPPHPWPPSAIRGVLETLGFDDATASSLEEAGLTVVSPELLASYAGGIDPIRSIGPKPEGAPAYLLDPAYGTLVWQGEQEFHQVPLVDFLRRRPRPSLPPHVQRRLAESAADALSEGLILAHTAFADVVRSHVPGAYDSVEVPEIELRDSDELAALVERLEARCQAADIRLWYRGQTNDYPMPARGSLTARGAVPYSVHGESSLVPALYRRIDGFLERVEDHERLVGHVLDWVSAAERLLGPSVTVQGPAAASGDWGHSLFTQWETSWSFAEGPGDDLVASLTKTWTPELRQVQSALLLQHYGCPTATLDVTWDPNVAVWFALNGCREERGLLRFERVRDPSERPTIFVFPLIDDAHPVLDTSRLLEGRKATRPISQKCGLLCGAGNIARNYAARFVGLKLRLDRDFGPPSCTAEELFPGPDDDDILRNLLESSALTENEFPVSRLATGP